MDKKRSLINRNHIIEFMEILRLQGDVTDFRQILKNKDSAKKFYQDLGLYHSGEYFGDLTAEVMSVFLNKNPHVFEYYLKNKMSINDFCQIFIKHLIDSNISFDKDKFTSCIAYLTDSVHNLIKKSLIANSYNCHVNILGYGIGNGLFENEIRELLIALGLTKTVEIYGIYPDKYHSIDETKILNPKYLSAINAPKFDIIIIKWVLHHIPYQERWENLLNCLNHCAPGAQIIIVEEGSFRNKTVNRIDVKLYEMLVACADVIINAALRYSWLADNTNSFFLSYLDCSDIETIEQGIKLPFKRSVFETDHILLGQTLITYKMDHH